MYENLRGKKLLNIGADVNDMEIVKTAHSMGIYVIVVDWNKDYSKSPAKQIADEAWDVNYKELDILADLCRQNRVDGIMAGYSETRVILASQLSKKLGKPFYATEEIVKITRDKRSFKNLCGKYDVPIPKEFCKTGTLTNEDISKISYPVIVKPADYGGRFGISICDKEEDLSSVVKKALAYSENKMLVVEEYVSGSEMSSIYNISNGEIALALVNDKYQVMQGGKATILCNATVTPSKHIKEYIETVDPHIREFLKGIEAKNGIAFFQMIAGDKGIKVFEMGYRLNGGNDQHIIAKFNNIDHMKMLISYSLTGNMGDDIQKNNPYFKEYIAAYLSYVHGGKVGKVKWNVKEGKDGIINITQKVFPGSLILENNTTQQEGIVFKIHGKKLEDVANGIDRIIDGVTIEDENGKDMLFERFDTKRLLK